MPLSGIGSIVNNNKNKGVATEGCGVCRGCKLGDGWVEGDESEKSVALFKDFCLSGTDERRAGLKEWKKRQRAFRVVDRRN